MCSPFNPIPWSWIQKKKNGFEWHLKWHSRVSMGLFSWSKNHVSWKLGSCNFPMSEVWKADQFLPKQLFGTIRRKDRRGRHRSPRHHPPRIAPLFRSGREKETLPSGGKCTAPRVEDHKNPSPLQHGKCIWHRLDESWWIHSTFPNFYETVRSSSDDCDEEFFWLAPCCSFV